MLNIGHFNLWIEQFLTAHKEKLMWEHWLHKVMDLSWAEYTDLTERKTSDISLLNDTATWEDSEIETTIKSSHNILENFNAEEVED